MACTGWFLASLCLLCSEKLPANLCLPRQSRLLLSCPYLQESLLITACSFSKTSCLDPCWDPATGRWYLVLGSYFTSLQTAWEPFPPTPHQVLTTQHQTLWNLEELKARHSQADLHHFFLGFTKNSAFSTEGIHPQRPGKDELVTQMAQLTSYNSCPFSCSGTRTFSTCSSPGFKNEGTAIVFLCQATRITQWVGDCA